VATASVWDADDCLFATVVSLSLAFLDNAFSFKKNVQPEARDPLAKFLDVSDPESPNLLQRTYSCTFFVVNPA